MAEYWIHHTTKDKKSKKITHVRAFLAIRARDGAISLEGNHYHSVDNVIDNIRRRDTYFTCTQNANGTYRQGAEVHYFLRSHQDGTPSDNLDNLPED